MEQVDVLPTLMTAFGRHYCMQNAQCSGLCHTVPHGPPWSIIISEKRLVQLVCYVYGNERFSTWSGDTIHREFMRVHIHQTECAKTGPHCWSLKYFTLSSIQATPPNEYFYWSQTNADAGTARVWTGKCPLVINFDSWAEVSLLFSF